MHRLQHLLFYLACLVTAVVHAIRPTIVRFEIVLTEGAADPVGIGARQVILVNGDFVGPTLHANQGEDVEFLVNNHMKQNTSVHFHGISQRLSPWADGVPGVTQEPIQSGASFLYRWRADEAGVYFYHGHARSQMMDGLYGAIIISSADDVNRPFHAISSQREEQLAMRKAEKDMQTLIVSDWTQFTSTEFHDVQAAANIELACVDAIIINGRGASYCLDETTRDSLTHPLVLQMLKDFGINHLTNKSCVPAIQAFQGDFDLHLETLPDMAYDKCIPGEHDLGNWIVPVSKSKQWAALTFINSGSFYPLQVSVDNHKTIAYAIDGHYIDPIDTDRLLVNTGSRVSILVKLDQKPARYAIRVANDYLCQVLGAHAELVYDDTHKQPDEVIPKMDYAGHVISNETRSFIPEVSRPFPPKSPARHADRTFKTTLKKLGRPYGSWEYTLTGSEGYNYTRERSDPPLLFGDPGDVPSSELILRSKHNEWVDVIFITDGPFSAAHPLHKHGNKLFLIGAGIGRFEWESVDEAIPHLPKGTFNLDNPPYLDTFNTVEIEGESDVTWTAIRYHANVPGVWMLHCHVQSHMAGGMALVMMDGIDAWPEVPDDYLEWNGFPRPALKEHFLTIQDI